MSCEPSASTEWISSTHSLASACSLAAMTTSPFLVPTTSWYEASLQAEAWRNLREAAALTPLELLPKERDRWPKTRHGPDATAVSTPSGKRMKRWGRKAPLISSKRSKSPALEARASISWGSRTMMGWSVKSCRSETLSMADAQVRTSDLLATARTIVAPASTSPMCSWKASSRGAARSSKRAKEVIESRAIEPSGLPQMAPPGVGLEYWSSFGFKSKYRRRRCCPAPACPKRAQPSLMESVASAPAGSLMKWRVFGHSAWRMTAMHSLKFSSVRSTPLHPMIMSMGVIRPPRSAGPGFPNSFFANPVTTIQWFVI
mmetsp:Transcript_28858/g.84245  ORF Transcript_28858/g.84245 Transcript_28858/m.84245 type:complete len:316 (+) Transcript_28858:1546-2493(+)